MLIQLLRRMKLCFLFKVLREIACCVLGWHEGVLTRGDDLWLEERLLVVLIVTCSPRLDLLVKHNHVA